MQPESPWSGLPVAPAGSLEARRAEADHPCNFFFARNSQGDFMLTLQLTCPARVKESLPSLRGVEVIWIVSLSRLQLRLCSASDKDMFAVLCRDLLRYTRSSSCDDDCIDRVLSRLARWQRLLGRKQSGLMTEEQIRGLVAELLFLRDDLLPRFGPTAVDAWKGPQGYPQDFAIDGLAIEVKSHLVGSPAQVHISSPEQLAAEGFPLYLRVQRLAKASSEGLDLLSLVDDISNALANHPSELASFEMCLREIGYEAAHEYSAYKLLSEGSDAYLVTDGFPKLLPQDIPAGICSVMYSIQLAALDRYRAQICWNKQGAVQ